MATCYIVWTTLHKRDYPAWDNTICYHMTISSNFSYIHTYEWIVLSESPASYRLGQNHWPIPDRRGRRMSVSSVFLNMTEDVHQCEWGRRHIFIQKYVVFLFSIAFSLKNNICWYSIRFFLCSSEFKIQSKLNLCFYC